MRFVIDTETVTIFIFMCFICAVYSIYGLLVTEEQLFEASKEPY